MSEAFALSGRRENTSRAPSADQPGSLSDVSCGSSSSGVPPCAEMAKIFQGLPVFADMNATFVPSGDQRGNAIPLGGDVSCSLALPSIRLTHNVKAAKLKE